MSAEGEILWDEDDENQWSTVEPKQNVE